MTTTQSWPSLSETDERGVLLRNLADRVHRIVLTSGEWDSRIPGLHLSYVQTPNKVLNCFYVLSVGLILQGRKHLNIGKDSYEYGAGSMIVTSVDMPTSYELLDVTPSNPFISLSLKLNPAILAEIISSESTASEHKSNEVFSIDWATQELLEDFDRLLRLLERPQQIETRAPLLIKDIHYLALAGTAGESLRSLYAPGAVGQRIRRVIHWMRENFREPITIEQLSDVAGMSSTTLHRHFKAFTSLSPVQYQKRLRLYEAQQFLIRGDGDVNSAAYAVGYQSPQQFNRDYKKFFGITPGKSTKNMKRNLLSSMA
jgi:transcriptional regulator, araC family